MKNIRYRKVPDYTRKEGFSYYPFLNVYLRHGVNLQPAGALVDSGSLDSIFPASLGQVLGFDVPSGESHNFHAFNLQETEGFVHKVSLQVIGFERWIDIDVVFIDSEVVPILGQNGFFEHYQVVFERYKRTFDINTKVDAMLRNRRGYGRGR